MVGVLLYFLEKSFLFGRMDFDTSFKAQREIAKELGISRSYVSRNISKPITSLQLGMKKQFKISWRGELLNVFILAGLSNSICERLRTNWGKPFTK